VACQGLVKAQGFIHPEVLETLHGYVPKETTLGVCGYGYPFDPGG
jgi:hypothetical protein